MSIAALRQIHDDACFYASHLPDTQSPLFQIYHRLIFDANRADIRNFRLSVSHSRVLVSLKGVPLRRLSPPRVTFYWPLLSSSG